MTTSRISGRTRISENGEQVPDEIKFRNLSLNDLVSLELPVSIWLGFLYTYNSADWNDVCAGRIAVEIHDNLLDPLYLKEQQAAAQAHADQHLAAFAAFTGQQIEQPPNVTDGPIGFSPIQQDPEDDDGDPVSS
jgi:hypothetical protein